MKNDNLIWTNSELNQVLSTNIAENSFGKVQFNSKEVEEGDLFIALPGATFDGHDFVEDALNRGAKAAIINKNLDHLPANCLITVPDTREALNKMAQFKRSNSKAKFIAITGSVGKTTTKEIIFEMLKPSGRCFKSRGNFNNELGLAINFASMNSDLDYAVIEIGMNSAGEIRELTKSVKPYIALITNVTPAHLEFFKSLEEISRAKLEIFEGLTDNGYAIINRDSEFYNSQRDFINHLNIKNIVTFGEDNNSDLKLQEYLIQPHHTEIKYSVNNLPVSIVCNGLTAKHLAVNFAAALAVASILKIDLTSASKTLSEIVLSYGRGKIIDFGNFAVISDYYNASPASMKASLEFFSLIRNPNKTLIIGDMLELGHYSLQLHLELIPYIIKTGSNKVICIGQYSKYIHDNLPKNLESYHFDNVENCLVHLPNIIDYTGMILIKASKGIKLKKIMDYFNEKFKDK